MSGVKGRSGRYKDGYTATRKHRCPSGRIIEQARFDRNLSAGQVAIKAHISEQTVRHIETEGVLCTRVVSLIAISRALELDPLRLIEADLGKPYDEL